MGCFSYLCKECGEGVNSDSFSGELCRIYLLKDGEIVQEMRGQYNSYGQVFDPRGGDDHEWEGDWRTLVGLHFNGDNTTGFAIVHEDCYVSLPKTISQDDPNQGWGDYLNPDSGETVESVMGGVLEAIRDDQQQ